MVRVFVGISLAAFLSIAGFGRSAETPPVTNPVVNSTGLEGFWDFDIKWTPRGLLSQAGADGITVSDALDKQLGLKLEPQKTPGPVIVVDSVNQTPTPNPSGVATSLPPAPPPEFEVADIKPSLPGASSRGRIQ